MHHQAFSKEAAVLCAAHNSNYYNYNIFDIYDCERNAFAYTGGLPVIAHPPCRLFSRLRAFSTAPPREKLLAYFCLEKVRRYGGVLEHPRSSTLWHNGNFDLSGNVDSFGGFLRAINLSDFGFPAQKKTLLYFCGISPGELPPFPLSMSPPTAIIGSSGRLPELPRSARSMTPPAMIDYFLQCIFIINSRSS